MGAWFRGHFRRLLPSCRAAVCRPIMQIYEKRSRTRLHSPQRSLPSLHLSIPGTDRSIDLVASLSSLTVADAFSSFSLSRLDWRNDGGLRLSVFLSRPSSCPDFILT
ncbi:hypothetical protein B296_00012217 [Ensete ventricosum]|uniref:Uncharacterized protein n=1 Tax=Ensete ventricosum TaxID=4639 RepID=A0A426Z5L1_ENSVE|nr:hypothetical protein B296_00012217 [Ensete ventricosum]